MFEQACKLGVEGIVAKRAHAPYGSRRQESWIKLKCKKSDTCPIVAFVEKLGAKPRKIASLYVGRREGGKLVYAGKVRTGFTGSLARELRDAVFKGIRDDLAAPKVKAPRLVPSSTGRPRIGVARENSVTGNSHAQTGRRWRKTSRSATGRPRARSRNCSG